MVFCLFSLYSEAPLTLCRRGGWPWFYSNTTLHTFVSIPELFCCTCEEAERETESWVAWLCEHWPSQKKKVTYITLYEHIVSFIVPLTTAVRPAGQWLCRRSHFVPMFQQVTFFKIYFFISCCYCSICQKLPLLVSQWQRSTLLQYRYGKTKRTANLHCPGSVYQARWCTVLGDTNETDVTKPQIQACSWSSSAPVIQWQDI